MGIRLEGSGWGFLWADRVYESDGLGFVCFGCSISVFVGKDFPLEGPDLGLVFQQQSLYLLMPWGLNPKSVSRPIPRNTKPRIVGSVVVRKSRCNDNTV